MQGNRRSAWRAYLGGEHLRRLRLQFHDPTDLGWRTPPPTSRGTGGGMSNAPHILVIDDEPQILRAIRTILTEKQFRVTTASRGEEGLTLAATNQPDLIILDLGLPYMDRVKLCTRLRVWSHSPFIFFSVRVSERDKVAALD